VIDIVLATRNRGKVADVQHLLGGLGVRIVPVDEVPGVPEVEETGVTFAENAVLKARTVGTIAGVPTLADDSGLEVDALGGAPGVYSARYAAGAGDRANNEKLLGALVGVPAEKRTARFRSVVAFYDPKSGELLLGEGACEGVVLDEPRGAGGFGYDPLFYSPELGMTFAEAHIAQKGYVSHRARAFADLLPKLGEYLGVAFPPRGG
jgi:XTP/dITP diphosphohydrolase